MNPLPEKCSTRPTVHVLLACVLASAVGCGLGDYEARIDTQRKRIEILDEETRYLGEPIENPKYEAKDGTRVAYWPFEVFLRLPKEMGASVKATYIVNAQPLFRYGAGEKYGALVAAGRIPEKKEGKEKDSKPTPPEWPVETFRANVR